MWVIAPNSKKRGLDTSKLWLLQQLSHKLSKGPKRATLIPSEGSTLSGLRTSPETYAVKFHGAQSQHINISGNLFILGYIRTTTEAPRS